MQPEKPKTILKKIEKPNKKISLAISILLSLSGLTSCASPNKTKEAKPESFKPIVIQNEGNTMNRIIINEGSEEADPTKSERLNQDLDETDDNAESGAQSPQETCETGQSIIKIQICGQTREINLTIPSQTPEPANSQNK